MPRSTPIRTTSPPPGAEAPYGWVERVTDHGTVTVPLTYEELLHPREGEKVTQDNDHQRLLQSVAWQLRRWFEKRPGFGVFSDLLVCWTGRAEREVGPDVLVLDGLDITPAEVAGRLDIDPSKVRSRLVVEIVSPTWPKTRRKDYEANFELYEQVGVEEYLIIDPIRRGSPEPPKLRLFKLGADGRFEKVAADADGWRHAVGTGLRFLAVHDEHGRRLRIEDLATGESLPSPEELEERTDAVERENERLRAELERLRRGAS